MNAKVIEIRDKMTYIPVLAIRPDAMENGDINPYVQAALSWAGYGFAANNSVIVVNLHTTEAHNNPYLWENSRTMNLAHEYIEEHYDDLKDFDIVDVEYIQGEQKTPKGSYYEERIKRMADK